MFPMAKGHEKGQKDLFFFSCSLAATSGNTFISHCMYGFKIYFEILLNQSKQKEAQPRSLA